MVNLATPVRTTDTPQRPVRVPGLSGANILGEVLHPDTRYVLDEDEDGIRRMCGPDLSFIRRERMPLPPYPPGFVRLVPDLIVEVRSPHDTFSELQRRINDFLEAGTRLAWLVDPLKRTVTIFAPGREPHTLDAAAELDGEEVVPGFRLSVGSIFA